MGVTKALVTNFIFHAVNSTDSADTHTWNYSPVPMTCQQASGSVVVTMPGFPSRTSETTYSVKVRARSRLGVRGPWSDAVTATTTAISMQITGGGNTDPDPEDELTASFEQVPAEHDGNKRFSFLVRLSETVGNFSKSPRASSFDVTRGRVRKVEQADAGLWRVEVKPNSWRNVGVTLAGGRDCDDPGAVVHAGHPRVGEHGDGDDSRPGGAEGGRRPCPGRARRRHRLRGDADSRGVGDRDGRLRDRG